jgi:hypothetical protein
MFVNLHPSHKQFLGLTLIHRLVTQSVEKGRTLGIGDVKIQGLLPSLVEIFAA